MDKGPGKSATVDAAPHSRVALIERPGQEGKGNRCNGWINHCPLDGLAGNVLFNHKRKGAIMRSRIQPFVVIALNREFKDQSEEKEFWSRYDFRYKPVYGVYKGESELSYIIPVDPDERALDVGALRSLAYRHNQESILVVHGDGSAFLHYTSDPRYGEVEYLGRWRDVPESVAKAGDCYTYDPSTGEYYLAG